MNLGGGGVGSGIATTRSAARAPPPPPETSSHTALPPCRSLPSPPPPSPHRFPRRLRATVPRLHPFLARASSLPSPAMQPRRPLVGVAAAATAPIHAASNPLRRRRRSGHSGHPICNVATIWRQGSLPEISACFLDPSVPSPTLPAEKRMKLSSSTALPRSLLSPPQLPPPGLLAVSQSSSLFPATTRASVAHALGSGTATGRPPLSAAVRRLQPPPS